MLIGAAVNGKDKNARVTENYEDASNLIIVETDDHSIQAVYSKLDRDGIFFADKLYEHDCEAVVCGIMQMPGFERVAGYCITRYLGVGLPLMEAIDGALNNTLANIVDYEGGTGCDHTVHACTGDCAACEEACSEKPLF